LEPGLEVDWELELSAEVMPQVVEVEGVGSRAEEVEMQLDEPSLAWLIRQYGVGTSSIHLLKLCHLYYYKCSQIRINRCSFRQDSNN
jgi:hypothetical protein